MYKIIYQELVNITVFSCLNIAGYPGEKQIMKDIETFGAVAGDHSKLQK